MFYEKTCEVHKSAGCKGSSHPPAWGISTTKTLGSFPVEMLRMDHSRAKRKVKGGKPLLMATFAFDSSKQESSSICQERWEGSSNCLEAATDAGLTPAAAALLRGNQIIFLSTHLSAF